VIDIEGVVRKYGDRTAVRGVSLHIGRGEVVGLLGHNGAGKTTLIKMLTGYLEPTGGHLRVGGHDLVHDRAAAQRLIGYLPEHAPVYPEMIVQEYLLLMAELRGVPADARVAAVARAVRATGLESRLVQPIAELSKGYRQRVGIAQAIVHQPAVLVLDEPTNGLDPVQIQSIRDLIRRLARDTTIILSTHILQEVEAVCERVVVLIDGVLAADAPIDTLLAGGGIAASLQGADATTLATLPGIRGARDLGPDPKAAGFVRYAIDAEPGAVPTLAAEAARRGWAVASVGPVHWTLDEVFRRLQTEYAARGES